MTNTETTETNERFHDISGVCGTTHNHNHGTSVCSLDINHTGRHLDATYGYFEEV